MIRGGIAHNTLSNANQMWDWRICADFVQELIKIARPLYADEDLGGCQRTKNFTVPAKTIVELYRHRWQVELFIKWIKRHLRIKSFFGVTENAVKSQIWIVISVYVLIAIVKKCLKLESEFYTILQILSLSLFEKTPLDQLLTNPVNKDEDTNKSK